MLSFIIQPALHSRAIECVRSDMRSDVGAVRSLSCVVTFVYWKFGSLVSFWDELVTKNIQRTTFYATLD